jgi:predicted nucleotidyltransferase
MPLPDFKENGDLPEGVHLASLDEILERFGKINQRHEEVTARLLRVLKVARGTEKLSRFVIFGSYITNKEEPKDVDIILIMDDSFRLEDCNEEEQKLFYHGFADSEFGASVFWARPSLLILETVDEFIAHWQTTRAETKRGIVEVKL